jgi:hypothetical protein
MNQYELKMQQRRLMESQEKFVKAMYLMFDVAENLGRRLSASEKYLDASRDADAARSGSMDAQRDMLDAILEALESMQRAFATSNAAINNNSDRMDKLITKFETYFGTSGLDYDN